MEAENASKAWVDVETAWDHIDAALEPLKTEVVSTRAALGRVLAATVRVDRDQPPFDRAAMDGFAVRSADLRHASPQSPVTLRLVGESTPGNAFGGAATAGSAVRIMTGAPVPVGWDAIVPVEETSGFEAPLVAIHHAAASGQHIARRGSERAAQAELLRPGRRLCAADVGALAIVGATGVTVYKRPSVALLATGNELVDASVTPAQYQIRNSNSVLLQALVEREADVTRLGIALDDPASLQAGLARGLQADLLIVTGGISMGRYDLVGAALAAAGVAFRFQRVALQPGKPVAFGTHTGGAVLALPGNPVSAFVTARLFVRPALARLQGAASGRPRFATALARFAWERRNPKWLLLPGQLLAAGQEVARVAYQGSGDLLAYAEADCHIVLPPSIVSVKPGVPVPVWPFESCP